jgi:hypothetical protein
MTEARVLGQRALREALRTPDALVPTLFIPLFFLPGFAVVAVVGALALALNVRMIRTYD